MKAMFALFLVILSSFAKIQADSETALPKIITHDNGSKFILCSQQKITKALFFNILNVGLYYAKCPKDIDVFDNVDKLIRFSYLRKVTGKQFSEGAKKFLKKNLTSSNLYCLEKYTNINASYQDVKKGDFYDLYFFNKQGLELFLNYNFLAKMNALDCDNQYFNIWFGKVTMDSGFTRLISKPVKSKG